MVDTSCSEGVGRDLAWMSASPKSGLEACFCHKSSDHSGRSEGDLVAPEGLELALIGNAKVSEVSIQDTKH